MRKFAWLLVAVAVAGQDVPKSVPPTAAEKQQLRGKLQELESALNRLRPRYRGTPKLADVEVYAQAAANFLRFGDEEAYTAAYVPNTLGVLERGLARAKALSDGTTPWLQATGRLAGGYRSLVDGSVQPFGLIVPADYVPTRSMRLDVVLHGRDAKLSEVSFLHTHDSDKPLPPGQDFIQLDVFGRTNNAYRWAGETDVLEAIAAVQHRYNINPWQIVLRGFSMGGAGAWQLGLHYPDRWAAVEAGAGFTETQQYLKLKEIPPYQAAAQHIYDARDYAVNAFNVPTVGYGGEIDPQLQASRNVQAELKKYDVTTAPTLFLVGPGTQHKWHPDSLAQSEAFLRAALAKGTRRPDHVRFVTYTTRYHRCFWVDVDGLEKMYQRAEVDAERTPDGQRTTVRTTNVSRLILPAGNQPQTIRIDEQTLTVPAQTADRVNELLLTKQGTQWTALTRPVALSRTDEPLRKRPGLQGPIDDAFLDGFLVVRPTGKPFSPAIARDTMARLTRFEQEYAKFMRGAVRQKTDQEIDEQDLDLYNLVLFGDPSSNRLLARIADKLPIKWTAQSIQVGARTFPSATHLPVLIFPNPLNPRRYVVINTGHTVHDKDLRASNAWFFPRLGDYAVLPLSKDGVLQDEPALAGLFDESWRLVP